MILSEITSRLRDKWQSVHALWVVMTEEESERMLARVAPVVASMLEEETRELAKERDWYRGAWLKQTTARQQAEAETQALREALAITRAALAEVSHHADDECGFMVDVRRALAASSSPSQKQGDLT